MPIVSKKSVITNNLKNIIKQLDLFKYKRELVRANTLFFNSLPKHIKESLRLYKYTAFSPINKYLRDPDNDDEPFTPFRFNKTFRNLYNKLLTEYENDVNNINDETTLKE